MTDDSVHVHLDELGAGPDVVLLHGTPMNPLHMHLLAREFATIRRYFVSHRPGYGRSPAHPPGHSVEDIQAVVERALVARGVTRAVLVGLSGADIIRL